MGSPRTHMLLPRVFHMSAEDWSTFDLLGGEAWLRSRMRRAHLMGYAKRGRNNRIRADSAAGMTDIQLAEKYQLDRSTIWRILQ